jgi:hypothetical protein
MAWNDSRVTWRQISFDDVEIRAAYAAGSDAQQDVAWLDAWIGNFCDLKRALRDWSR